jgi:hypothetical protein
MVQVRKIRERAADDLKNDNPKLPPQFDGELQVDVASRVHMTDQEYDDFLTYKYGDDPECDDFRPYTYGEDWLYGYEPDYD